MRKLLTMFMMIAACTYAHAQKGSKSVAAGLFFSIPDGATVYNREQYSWRAGPGLVLDAQTNVADNHALLLQLQVSFLKGRSDYTLNNPTIIPLSLKAGYRYLFAESGYYVNALVGPEYADNELYLPAAVGGGRRFTFENGNFLDAGIEITGGYLSRINLKILVGLVNSVAR